MMILFILEYALSSMDLMTIRQIIYLKSKKEEKLKSIFFFQSDIHLFVVVCLI